MYLSLLVVSQFFPSFGNVDNSFIWQRSIPESHRSTNQNLRYSSNSLLYGEMITSQSSNNQNKGKLQDMLNALGERETGKKSGDTSQYKFENQELGFIGKYQFAEILLIRLGYYKAKIYYGNGADKNYWRGTWTNKRGIDSKTKLLNSPEVQEAAIREAFEVYLQDINYLLKQRRKSINEYLGKQGKFNDNGKSKNIKVTLSGLMAAAHLRGADKVVDLLVLGKVSRDEFGTSILEYLDKFGGYETTPKDFQVRG